MEQFNLNGKVALVTGASYGIGYAIASALAGAGAKIVFNDLKQEFVDKGLSAYKEAGIPAKGYVCDVTDENAVNAMVAQIEKEMGGIDILVNNAGIIKRIPMHEMSAEEFRQVIDVDLNAPFIVAKARAIQYSMQRHRSGIYCDTANGTFARDTTRRLKTSVRFVYHCQDSRRTLGYTRRSGRTGCVSGFKSVGFCQWPYPLCRRRYFSLYRETAVNKMCHLQNKDIIWQDSIKYKRCTQWQTQVLCLCFAIAMRK